MFITKKRHNRELLKLGGQYEKILDEVSTFHQFRELKIKSIIDEYHDRFSNTSASKCVKQIKDVISVKIQPNIYKNGTEEAI
jgi:cobalamin biosynthesis Co2+ chelatase CbiK|tara:strand:- start:174 stop:419 length:246 start_codon:yes stop_codon:yes gene_type:complete